MKKNVFLILVSLIISVFINTVVGQTFDPDLSLQDTTQVHQLKTKKGDIFIGKTLSIDNNVVHFLFNKHDTLSFQLVEITSLTVYSPHQENDDSTSLDTDFPDDVEDVYSKEESVPLEVKGSNFVFFSPSSFLLRKREGEVRSFGLLINSLDYGVSNNLTIGTDFTSKFAYSLFSLKMKIGFSAAEYLHLSAGARVHFQFSEDIIILSSYYGSITLGTREKFVTASAGLITKENNFLKDGLYLSFGGSLRIANQWKILADVFLTGVSEEVVEENTHFFSSPMKHPSTNVFIGTSYFGHKHRVDMGFKITDTIRLFGKGVRIAPVAAYGLTF